jgi:hypothetical protein
MAAIALPVAIVFAIFAVGFLVFDRVAPEAPKTSSVQRHEG